MELNNDVLEFKTSRPATQQERDLHVNGNLRALPGNFESLNTLLNSFLINNRIGHPLDYVTTLGDRYAKISVADIQRVASETFHQDKLTWLVVGDREQIEDKIRALDFGPVEIRDSDGNVLTDEN